MRNAYISDVKPSGPGNMAAQRVIWTQAMEAQLVELWQAQSSLFDVSSQNYHDRNNREKGWVEIAAELHLPVNEVKTRVTSLRTQYGKLLRPKPSGSGHKPLTPKQMWIQQHLEFLRPLVIHRRTESTLTLGTESEDTRANDEKDEDQSIVEFEEDVCTPLNNTSPVSVAQEEESSSTSSQLIEATVQPVKRPRLIKPTPKSAENRIGMAKLSLLQQVQQTLAGSNADSEELFGQQVVSELRNIKDRDLQLRLRRNIMNIIYDTQEAEHGSHAQFTRPPLYPMHPYHFQPPSQDNQAPSTQPRSYLNMLNSD